MKVIKGLDMQIASPGINMTEMGTLEEWNYVCLINGNVDEGFASATVFLNPGYYHGETSADDVTSEYANALAEISGRIVVGDFPSTYGDKPVIEAVNDLFSEEEIPYCYGMLRDLIRFVLVRKLKALAAERAAH